MNIKKRVLFALSGVALIIAGTVVAGYGGEILGRAIAGLDDGDPLDSEDADGDGTPALKKTLSTSRRDSGV
jgi:hypothetical protein